MVRYLRISSYVRKPFLIYDFATAPFRNFLIHGENLVFFFYQFTLPLLANIGKASTCPTERRRLRDKKKACSMSDPPSVNQWLKFPQFQSILLNLTKKQSVLQYLSSSFFINNPYLALLHFLSLRRSFFYLINL